MLKLVSLTAVMALGAVAMASPAARKYHFEFASVTAKPEVSGDVATIAKDRVERQVKKAFTSHPQLVADVSGAPDPALAPDAYRKFLAKKAISASYLVTVEITEASQEITAMESKPKSQRAVVRLGIHVFGEAIPGRTMGFTGEGQAIVKLEIGKTLRDSDRDYAWDSAAETAVNTALKECFAKLAKPKSK